VAHQSSPWFRTFHSLRIKGFADVATVAEVAGVDAQEAGRHLGDLQSREWALFRENRGLWQLTVTGKDEHRSALADDVPSDVAGALRAEYQVFLELNESFKMICTDWQINGSQPNDHADDEYDDAIIDRLVVVHEKAVPVIAAMGDVLERLSPYPVRLSAAKQRLTDGNIKMLTGVMCNSYHDVWMELHEDLLLTQGIDRRAEGSF
jgi:hypothetical protein